MFICIHCRKECKNKNSHCNHERCCSLNPYRNYKNGMTGKTGDQYPRRKDFKPWNTNMTLDEMRPFYDKDWNFSGAPHTQETKDKLSVLACERMVKHSKYSKNIEYKPGIILESTYEIRVAEILDILGIMWIKVRQGYIWDDDGKTRRYIPDFYLPNQDIFLDPKNDYLIERDKRKIDSAMKLNNIKVIVISNEQITKEYIQGIVL